MAWLRPGYQGRLLAIVLAAALFRLIFLAREPLWRDEAFTAVVARLPFGDMLAAVERDSAPPLYYAIEHLASAVSSTPFALRLVSAVAGTILVPLVAALARRVGGDRAGLWAAIVVAVTPATVAASMDARMYALATTLAVGWMIVLWRAVERPGPARWLACLVLGTAAAWTDYFDLLALGVTLFAALLVLRPARSVGTRAVLATVVPAATLTPWLVAARGQLVHAGQGFWVRPPDPVVAGGTVAQFLAGPPVAGGVPLGTQLQALQLVSVAVGFAVLASLVARRRRLPAPSRRAALFCGAAGVGGVIVLAAATPWRPLLDARYASVTWAPLYALVGVALALLPGRRLASLAAAGVAVSSLALSVAVTNPRTDLLLPEIEARTGPSDVVAAHPSQYLLVLELADEALRARLRVIGTDVPWYWGTAAYPSGAIIASVPADVVSRGGRILYVSEPSDPPPALPADYRTAERLCQVDACLTVYAPR